MTTPTNTPAVDNPTMTEQPTAAGALTVRALRRSSSHVTPTRTLLLSEQEEAPRFVSPLQIPHRPRSNQRTRTPRGGRYESPMDPAAFRRTSVQEETQHENGQPRLMGTVTLDRGTAVTEHRHHHRPVVEQIPLSRKQGPSHRKVRRWRNEQFDDLAFEVAASSSSSADGGHRAAEALRKAKEKAHLYKDIVNFKEQESEPLTRFMKDDKLQGVRDKFFAGELPVPQTTTAHREKAPVETLTPQEKLFRVDARLRRVVTKACRNSQPAAMVVKTLESFIMATYYHRHHHHSHTSSSSKRFTAPTGQWWSTLLTQAPTVTTTTTRRRENEQSVVNVQFLFDAASPTGGFHRLLLHAVCQYHGLTAVSQMTVVAGRSNRALLVSGATIRHKHTLLEQLIDDAAQVEMLEEPWTSVKPVEEIKEEGEWAVVKS